MAVWALVLKPSGGVRVGVWTDRYRRGTGGPVRTAAIGAGRCKHRVVCKNVSRSTDACDRLKLSGIAAHYSGHPIRTRSVLADAAGTVRAVFLWSVERLRHLLGASRFGQPGVLRIVASRWVTRGLRDPMPLRASPQSQQGVR